MGKKTKKTKWRTLEISLPVAGKNYHENSANLQWDEGWRLPSHKYRQSVGGSCDKIIRTSSSTGDVTVENLSCKESRAKTLIEEEYTKITTPRQDVLFKKGYLTKRKTSHHISDKNIAAAAAADIDATNGVINVCCIQPDCASKGEEELCDYANTETNVGGGLLSQSQMQSQAPLLCAAPQPYLDASSGATAAIYYGGGYEIYDPYTGNVTALVVGTASPPGNGATAAATCQPILASMPCRPVPLQPLQWFSPIPSSSEWCCGAYTTPTLPATQQTEAVNTVIDTAASATDFDDSVAQAPYFDDSKNLNAPHAELPCSAENTATTPILTTDDGDGGGGGGGDGDDNDDDDGASSLHPLLQQSHLQSYAYPGCVFATSVCDVENDGGNIRYNSSEFPILDANKFAATKRKKKRKRRRRFGDTEVDSESDVEENPNECVASSECVFAYACGGGNNEDEDETVDDDDDDDDDDDVNPNVSGAMVTQCHRHTLNGWQTAYQHRRKCAATLSRASVNAPSSAPQTPPPHAHPQLVSRSLRNSESGENLSDNVELESESMSMAAAAAAAATATANVGSSVRRTLLVDNDNKSLTDSPFSSSNTDSGISSPANEDCSSMVVERQDLRKPVIADRSKNVVDRPDNDIDNDYGNGQRNSWSAAVTASVTVNDSAGGANTPTSGNNDVDVDVDGRARSSSVQLANGDKHDRWDKLSKKARTTRVDDVAKRYRRKNDDCDDRPEAAIAGNASNAGNAGNIGDRRNYSNDDLDGDDGHAASRAFGDTAIAVFASYPTTVIVGCDQAIYRGHEQRQQSLWQRNASSEYGGYEGETDWSNVRRNDIDDTGHNETSRGSANCSVDLIGAKSEACGKAYARSTCDGQLSQVDENDSFRPRDGFDSEKVEPLWPRTISPSTMANSLRQRDENSSAVRNTDVDVKFNADVETLCFPSHRLRGEKWDASREFVELTASAFVEEIIQEAELRIRTCTATPATKKCDKLRLPLTQAVTDWLNERGGLPAAVTDSNGGRRRILTLQRVDDSSDSCATHEHGERAPRSNTSSSLGNPKTWSNCVIC